MIPRYSVPQIEALFSDTNKFDTYLKVEIALAEEWVVHGVAPPALVEQLKKVQIRVSRIEEIEQKTRHDVLAFCAHVEEQIHPEVAKYFHFGVTSSDIIDTALALTLTQALDHVLIALHACATSLLDAAERNQTLLGLGRSHGRIAEPMIFGQKFLSHADEFLRRYQRVKQLKNTEICGKLSGAIGSHSTIPQHIEIGALSRLGIRPSRVSTQVVPRDHLASLITEGALIGCAIERLATEIRLLHHSGLDEVHESFSDTQKGSSIMPHKKNPISAENLTGIARVLRSHVTPILESTVLWHERDISHSSVERLLIPDHFGLLVYGLNRTQSLISQLQVRNHIIEKALELHPEAQSSWLLHEELKDTSKSRQEVYQQLQNLALKNPDVLAWNDSFSALGMTARLKTPDEIRALLAESFQKKLFELRSEISSHSDKRS